MSLKSHFSSRTWLDRFGIGLSLLCAVHCLAAPLFFLVFPFLSHHHGIEFHLLMIALVAPIALITFWRTYRRHANPRPLILGTTGIMFLLLGVVSLELFHHESIGIWLDRILTVVGSLCLIVGHWRNLHQCACEHH